MRVKHLAVARNAIRQGDPTISDEGDYIEVYFGSGETGDYNAHTLHEHGLEVYEVDIGRDDVVLYIAEEGAMDDE